MVFVLSVLSLLSFSWVQAAEVSVFESKKLLGHEVRIDQKFEKASAPGGVSSSTDIFLLGRERSLMKVKSEPEVLDSGEVQQTNGLYVAGLRVWSGGGKVENQGYSYEGLIPPTQLAWPLVTYPLGPILLEIDVGVNYQASLKASAFPAISLPNPKLNLRTSLEAKAAGSGYLEGYAKFLVVRGGVGGALDLIDGQTKVTVEAELSSDLESIPEPTVEVTGKLTLLRGRVYGFVDTYRILSARWKRSLNKNFFVYPGKCWAFGVEKCETP